MLILIQAKYESSQIVHNVTFAVKHVSTDSPILYFHTITHPYFDETTVQKCTLCEGNLVKQATTALASSLLSLGLY